MQGGKHQRIHVKCLMLSRGVRENVRGGGGGKLGEYDVFGWILQHVHDFFQLDEKEVVFQEGEDGKRKRHLLFQV